LAFVAVREMVCPMKIKVKQWMLQKLYHSVGNEKGLVEQHKYLYNNGRFELKTERNTEPLSNNNV
jgi:hypothetical protein